MDYLLPLTQIEQGIKDAVAALNRSYIKTIATYGGEFDEDLSYAVPGFPAVWTTFEGSGTPEKIMSGRVKYRIPLTFVVLVGASSVRNEESARHGVKDANGNLFEVGTFQLLKDVLLAVLGCDFGLPIAHFELGRIRTIFNTRTNGEAISVIAQEFHTVCTVKTPDEEADAADWLERLNINYLFKPGDDLHDAADLVELKQD